MADPLEMPAGPQQFPSTEWSRLLQLHDPAHPRYQEVLSGLISAYWKPAYHYVRALRRVQVSEAMDLTQQFFTMLLARRDFEKITPDRGSFRGFLKTALRNFLVSNDRSKAARRPKGDARLFSFDPVDVEWMQAAEPSLDDPEAAFDREWARIVLLEGVRQLEEQLSEKGKHLYFEIFRDYCLEPSGVELADGTAGDASAGAPTYGELASRYDINEDAVRNYLRYARRELRALLRRNVREYLGEQADVELELKQLLA